MLCTVTRYCHLKSYSCTGITPASQNLWKYSKLSFCVCVCFILHVSMCRILRLPDCNVRLADQPERRSACSTLSITVRLSSQNGLRARASLQFVRRKYIQFLSQASMRRFSIFISTWGSIPGNAFPFRTSP